MTRVQSRWIGVLVTVAAVSLLATILLPPCQPDMPGIRKISCANNLRQLYQRGIVYAAGHHGEWPAAKGSALWLEFARTTPPLIGQDELEVLLCPVKGEAEIGHCDYLGPSKPFSELKSSDPLSADKPGNHGGDGSGNVLLKDGSVQEFELSHPIWKSLSE